MNYGHSFGHALEAATDFAVPHGIAVTIGMDMANYVAAQTGRADEAHFLRMHPVLLRNAQGFRDMAVPMAAFLRALGRDKKNQGARLTLILPDADGVPQPTVMDNSPQFADWCTCYFREVLPDA